jgi:molecular chaperone DnaK (HSP70)
MHLGVDFGTTRTIVARADRGNYPVVGFEDADGDPQDFFPSLIALRGDDVVFGFEALAAARAGAPCLRSVKRLLGEPGVSADTVVALGGRECALLPLLTGFLAALRRALAGASDLAADLADPDVVLHTIASVPAHAHSAQRFLTLEAFHQAGFDVAGLVNEPSAAGFEYTHRLGRTLTSRRDRVLVYDLGGGTFDASLVAVTGASHEVLGSDGVNRLGGDDFDAVLADLALAAAGRPELDGPARDALLAECQEAKERLSPQSRRISLDVAGQPVLVRVEDFYAAVTPLVERSLEAMAPLLPGLEAGELGQVAGLYLVGGGTGLPLVPRLLKERFGRRVHRSSYPAASTAIGLAIAADPDSGYALADRLWRGFGVFRELDSGRAVGFDQLIDRDTPLPEAGPVEVRRRYRAAHNLGWFRFVEYSGLGSATGEADGEPLGDLAPFAEVRFGYDPGLQGRDLTGVAVTRRPGGPEIEETYTLDANGIVTVAIADLSTGYRQVHALG